MTGPTAARRAVLQLSQEEALRRSGVSAAVHDAAPLCVRGEAAPAAAA